MGPSLQYCHPVLVAYHLSAPLHCTENALQCKLVYEVINEPECVVIVSRARLHDVLCPDVSGGFSLISEGSESFIFIPSVRLSPFNVSYDEALLRPVLWTFLSWCTCVRAGGFFLISRL